MTEELFDPAIGMTVHYLDEDGKCWPAIVVEAYEEEVTMLAVFQGTQVNFYNDAERNLDMSKIISWHWPHIDVRLRDIP